MVAVEVSGFLILQVEHFGRPMSSLFTSNKNFRWRMSICLSSKSIIYPNRASVRSVSCFVQYMSKHVSYWPCHVDRCLVVVGFVHGL